MAHNGTFREQMMGFPVWQMVVISLIRVLEPIMFTSFFPYVYFMVRDFHVAPDASLIPKYSGYLAAAFSFTLFLFSVQWGLASDRIGRKQVLLIGLIGLACCMLVFGFAPNYYVALLARAAMGAINGNIGVIRTSIGEIATQKKHQAVAFSTVPLLWNLGSVLGPLIGGSKYLTRPRAEPHISGAYDNFMNKHPYALSNVVVAVFLLVSATVCFLFFEETHHRLKYRRDRGLDIGDRLLALFGYKLAPRWWHRPSRSEIQEASTPRAPLLDILAELDGIDSPGEETPLVRSNEVYDAVSDDSDLDGSADYEAAPLTRQMSAAIVRRYSTASFGPSFEDEDGRHTIFSREVFTRPVVQTMISNFLLAFQTLVYSEFLPILLAGKFDVQSLHFPFSMKGGFGYDSESIGTLLSTTGFFGVFVVAFLFPWMDRHIKTINGYRLSLVVPPFVFLMVPNMVFTKTEYNKNIAPYVTTVLLYVNSAVFTLSTATAFPHLVLLQHRAATPKHRAVVNGLSLSLNSLARCIAPIVWGALISYTDTVGAVPVSWYILAFSALGTLVQGFFMRDYDEEARLAQTQT